MCFLPLSLLSPTAPGLFFEPCQASHARAPIIGVAISQIYREPSHGPSGQPPSETPTISTSKFYAYRTWVSTPYYLTSYPRKLGRLSQRTKYPDDFPAERPKNCCSEDN